MPPCNSTVYAILAGLSSVVVATPSEAAPQVPAAFAIGDAGTAGATTSQASRLATLPGTAEQLTFSGESGVRQFAVYVMPLETTRPAKLILSMQSAVSIMPEASVMRIFVNDLPVGTATLGTGAQTLALDLAPGSLQPGFNQVRIAVDQHHRVDCSLAGTYEQIGRASCRERVCQYV